MPSTYQHCPLSPHIPDLLDCGLKFALEIGKVIFNLCISGTPAKLKALIWAVL